jgi:signal transduction histidine kinase
VNVPLRARLALVFAGSFALLLVTGAGIVFWQFRRRLYADFDRSMVASAETAQKLFENDREEQGTPAQTVVHILSELPFGDRTLVAYDSTGTRLMTSEPATGMPRFDDAPSTAPIDRPVTLMLRRGKARVLGVPLEAGVRLVIGMSPITVDRQLDQLLRAIAGMFPLVLLVGGALGAWGAGFVLRPVNQVAVLADELGRAALAGESNFTKLPLAGGRDEIATVATAFNRLVDRLGEAIGRERRIADQQRTFLADAAHELRTPVAIIRSEAEVAVADAGDPPNHHEALRTIADEAGRLSDLVADLLFLARGVEPAAPGLHERVFLDDLANQAVRRLSKLPESAGRVIRWGQCDAAPALGSATLLERAIVVLIHNALVHAPGSPVELATGVQGGNAWVRVRDGGPGIPVADRSRIFDRFVRLGTNGPGSGLGLPIARAVALYHGGELVLEETPAGASFLLRIPADSTSRA